MSHPAPDPRPARYDVLDSLRGVCALMVVLYHLHPEGLIAASSLARHGWLFVDFFFVLSGFVISSSYGDRLAKGFGVARFMGLRLGRVYPLHLFSLAILVLFETLSWLLGGGQADGRLEFTGQFSFADLWQNLLLLQCFGLQDHLGWNSVSWSIAAEVWAYLFFALAMIWVRKGQGFFFAGVAVLALSWLWWRSDTFLEVTFDLGFVRCLYGFALGVLVRMLWHQWPRKASTLLECLIVVTVFGFVSWASTGKQTYLAPPLFALVVFTFASENGRISQLLQTAPFRLAGKLSYAIYMLHLFALARYFDLISGLEAKLAITLSKDVQTIGALLFVMLLAWPAWRFVELPMREWSRRKILPFPAK